MLSLIQIIQRVSPRLGYRAPTIALTSQDLNIQIITSFAQEEGDELMENHDWQQLTVYASVTATAAQIQAAFPDDFARLVERADIWNLTSRQKYYGPTEPHIWDEARALQTSGVGTGIWRIVGGRLNLLPAPTAGDIISYPYITTHWAISAGGTTQNSFLLDSDQPRLSDKLFTLGIRWRYRAMRGLDYAEDMESYERLKESLGAHDRGLGIIRKSSGQKRNDNLPVATWPGVITP